jgi:hypothetical protein
VWSFWKNVKERRMNFLATLIALLLIGAIFTIGYDRSNPEWKCEIRGQEYYIDKWTIKYDDSRMIIVKTLDGREVMIHNPKEWGKCTKRKEE